MRLAPSLASVLALVRVLVRASAGTTVLAAVLAMSGVAWTQEVAPEAELKPAPVGLWLSVSVESPAVSETIQVQVPLAAIANLIKALPEGVKRDLDEKKIPYDLIEVAAESFRDFNPMTILDHQDDATGDRVLVRTMERDGESAGKTAHYLRGVIAHPSTDEKAGSKTEFTLPLTAVERIGRQLQDLKLPVDLLGKPEEMKAAVAAFVAELQIAPPGDLVRINTAKQNIHVWTD